MHIIVPMQLLGYLYSDIYIHCQHRRQTTYSRFDFLCLVARLNMYILDYCYQPEFLFSSIQRFRQYKSYQTTRQLLL